MNPRRRRHARIRRAKRRSFQLHLDEMSRYHKAGKELLRARERAWLRAHTVIPTVPPMERYYYDRRFGA